MTSIVSTPQDSNDVVLDGRQVCIVDDDALCRSQISYLLSQKHVTVVEAADSIALQSVLDARMPDCLLIDYNLVSENGLFVIERLRQRYPKLSPIIIVSADETQKTTLRAFRTGVSDFIPKRGLRLDDLSSAIRRAIANHVHELARELEIEHLRRNAGFDELTGFFTCDAFKERLALVVDSACRKNSQFTMVALQIGRLVEVQDRFSIAVSDRIVRAFAQRLRDLKNGADFIGVWRRGVFVVVFPQDLSPREQSAVVETLANQMVLEFDLAAVHLSLGVLPLAVSFPIDGTNLDELLVSLDSRVDEQVRRFSQDAVTSTTEWVRLPNADEGASGIDRRREPRIRTLKHGLIRLDGLGSLIDCTVRNQSSGGACVRLTAPMAIPDFFHLRISDSGEMRRVHKCWHVNNDLGVEFLSG